MENVKPMAKNLPRQRRKEKNTWLLFFPLLPQVLPMFLLAKHSQRWLRADWKMPNTHFSPDDTENRGTMRTASEGRQAQERHVWMDQGRTWFIIYFLHWFTLLSTKRWPSPCSFLKNTCHFKRIPNPLDHVFVQFKWIAT